MERGEEKEEEVMSKTKRRKTYKIGESISFKDKGKRVTGKVVSKRKEFYWVQRGGKLYKVDRHSIFTALGSGIGKVVGGVVSFGKAGYQSYKLQREKDEPEIEKIRQRRWELARRR